MGEHKDSSIEDQICDFKDNKLWFTKKCRMEAENRVFRNDSMANLIINYYNLLVLSVSICTLIWESQIGVVLTTIVSVGLFGISNYLNSLNFKENGFKYRESYLRLSKLETKLENLILSEDIEDKILEFNNIKMEYNNVLELSYNHSDIDYISVVIQSNKCSKSYKKKYYWYKAKYYIYILIVLLLPLIIGRIAIIKGGM